MDDALLVGVLDGAADAGEEIESRLQRQIMIVAETGDGHAFHVLHDEIGSAGGSGSGIEDLGDVRVRHQRQRLSFFREAGDHLARVHAELDDLEGDEAVNRFALFGQPYGAIASFSELAEQGIPSDQIAGGGIGLSDGTGNGGTLEKVLGGLMSEDEGFDPRAEDDVIAAGAIKKCRSLAGGELQSVGEDVVVAVQYQR